MLNEILYRVSNIDVAHDLAIVENHIFDYRLILLNRFPNGEVLMEDPALIAMNNDLALQYGRLKISDFSWWYKTGNRDED